MLHFDFQGTIFHPIIYIYEQDDSNLHDLTEVRVYFVQMSLKVLHLVSAYIFYSLGF